MAGEATHAERLDLLTEHDMRVQERITLLRASQHLQEMTTAHRCYDNPRHEIPPVFSNCAITRNVAQKGRAPWSAGQRLVDELAELRADPVGA